MRKGDIACNKQFLLFSQCFLPYVALIIRPSKTGRIMGSPMAGGRAASTSLSGAYLQNYSSYGYEISWVDRSHQGGVQCAGIITLASLIFQLLPFVFFPYLNFVRSISPKLY